MKKLFVLCMVICMVTGMLAGCFESQDVSGNVSALDKENESTAAGTEADATEEPTAEVTEAPTAEATAEETQAPEQENQIGFGRMEGGVYTNTYAGFGCTLDENWSFYSATELQELPENTKELFENTEMGEISEKYSNVYDMMAENTTDLTSMNVVYTKVGFQERLAFLTMSEEEMIDSVMGNYDILVEAYTQAGFENIKIEKVRVTFLGQEHVAVKTSATVQGIDYYILQVADYTRGSYGVTLTVASFVENVTEELLALFYEVEA